MLQTRDGSDDRPDQSPAECRVLRNRDVQPERSVGSHLLGSQKGCRPLRVPEVDQCRKRRAVRKPSAMHMHCASRRPRFWAKPKTTVVRRGECGRCDQHQHAHEDKDRYDSVRRSAFHDPPFRPDPLVSLIRRVRFVKRRGLNTLRPTRVRILDTPPAGAPSPRSWRCRRSS